MPNYGGRSKVPSEVGAKYGGRSHFFIAPLDGSPSGSSSSRRLAGFIRNQCARHRVAFLSSQFPASGDQSMSDSVIARIGYWGTLWMILAVTAVLCGGFFVQFAQGEYPCPLCILERMAMILAMLGPVGLVLSGSREPHLEPDRFARAWGMLMIGSLIGIMISGRHVLLHIAPGDPGYGSPLFGMHLYTWALVVFLVLLAVAAFNFVVVGRNWPAFPARPTFFAKTVVGLFLLVVLANAVAVFFEAGFSLFLPDTPTGYRLID